jgi:hypothetical protein
LMFCRRVVAMRASSSVLAPARRADDKNDV